MDLDMKWYDLFYQMMGRPPESGNEIRTWAAQMEADGLDINQVAIMQPPESRTQPESPADIEELLRGVMANPSENMTDLAFLLPNILSGWEPGQPIDRDQDWARLLTDQGLPWQLAGTLATVAELLEPGPGELRHVGSAVTGLGKLYNNVHGPQELQRYLPYIDQAFENTGFIKWLEKNPIEDLVLSPKLFSVSAGPGSDPIKALGYKAGTRNELGLSVQNYPGYQGMPFEPGQTRYSYQTASGPLEGTQTIAAHEFGHHLHRMEQAKGSEFIDPLFMKHHNASKQAGDLTEYGVSKWSEWLPEVLAIQQSQGADALSTQQLIALETLMEYLQGGR
jgi:hypothetical protein